MQPCCHRFILAATRCRCRISREVAPLQVVTTCYTRVQQILLDRRVSAPKTPRRIVAGCSEPRSPGCLLRRTSENFSFFYVVGRIGASRGCIGARYRAPAATYISPFLGVTHSYALLPLLPPARRGRTLAACKTSLLRRSSATRGEIARPSLL